MGTNPDKILLEIAQIPENKLKCPKELQKSDVRCGEDSGCIGCPYLIKAPEYLNCAVVAWNFGPFNQEEVAEMTGLSQTRISVLEKRALEKMKKRFLRNKETAFEIEKSERLAEKRQNRVDEATIDILAAIVEKYERERNAGGSGAV